MFSASALLISFVLGGLTFVPILLASLLGLLYYTSPVVPPPSKTGIPGVEIKSEDEAEPVSLYRAGWLVVRRTYEPWLGANDGTYVGMIASGYRSFMDNRSRDPRRAKPKERFYAVLKQNTLFLFENEQQVDCWAAIEVSAHELLIYPDAGLDGELFVKRNAICLKPKQGEVDILALTHEGAEDKTHDIEPATPLPWYLFAQVNSDKEDWYHSLVQASKLGGKGVDSATALAKDRSLFDPDDMARLVDGIDQQPDSIPMRWLNALLGRVFLAVYRTSSLEEYITSRIVRKLKRVKTPSMLSEIKVREVNVGSAAPLFSKPMLKELTAEGDASMEVHVAYVGEFRITIETVATINLGSRFKPYSVKLVLAVVLKELEGTMLFKVKRPPSNRVWFGFTTMPTMQLSIEPVVSTRQIKWSMITSPIESRLREVIMESIVVPHMDDISFFNSQPFSTRGGIWGDALRKESDLSEPAAADAPVVGQPDDTGDTDSVAEPMPSVSGHTTPNESTTSAKEEESTTTRIRPRRRRSSEGDQNPLEFSTMDDANVPYKGSANSSSASLSSFSLASWRDAKAQRESSGAPSSTTGEKRRTWFGAGRSSSIAAASASPPTSPARASTMNVPPTSRTPSSDRVPSNTTATTDDSATRLREILQKRARSRERERSVEQVGEDVGLPSSSAPDVLVEAPSPTRDEPPPALSALSLTAPSSTSTSTSTSTSSLAPSFAAPSVESMPTDGLSTFSLSRKLSDSPSASSIDLVPETHPEATRIAPAADTSPPTSDIEKSLPARTTTESIPIADVSTTRDPAAIPTSPKITTSPRNSALIHGSPINRPAFIKARPQTPPPLPLPPPRRTFDGHVPPTAPTTASIISSWRTKASDKEAIAAGVAQAKDAMKRWGANWNARKKVGDDGPSEPQDGGAALGSPSSTGDDASYRDYRAGKATTTAATGGARDYYHPASTMGVAPVPMAGTSALSTAEANEGRARKNTLSSSPSTGHFTPAAPSPTTKISAVATLAAGSPEPPTTIGRNLPPVPKSPTTTTTTPQVPNRSYKPATMMAIPGIRDEGRRKAIAADHMAATEANGATTLDNGAETKAVTLPSLAQEEGSTRSTITEGVPDQSATPPSIMKELKEDDEVEATPIPKVKPPIPTRPNVFTSPVLVDDSIKTEKPVAEIESSTLTTTMTATDLLPSAPIDSPLPASTSTATPASRPAWIRNRSSTSPSPRKVDTPTGSAKSEDEGADEEGWGLNPGEQEEAEVLEEV